MGFGGTHDTSQHIQSRLMVCVFCECRSLRIFVAILTINKNLQQIKPHKQTNKKSPRFFFGGRQKKKKTLKGANLFCFFTCTGKTMFTDKMMN